MNDDGELLQDGSEDNVMKAWVYVWINSSDPDLYGEWNFEVA